MLAKSNTKNVAMWLALMTISCLLISCGRAPIRIDYIYEDITVTRIDYPDHSIYTCSNSSDEHYIKVTGVQWFYRAYLLIDKNTKKVWIDEVDCHIEQPKPDEEHFEICPQTNIYKGSSDDIHKKMVEQYECYALFGLRVYSMEEVRETQRLFPKTKIRAINWHYQPQKKEITN